MKHHPTSCTKIYKQAVLFYLKSSLIDDTSLLLVCRNREGYTLAKRALVQAFNDFLYQWTVIMDKKEPLYHWDFYTKNLQKEELLDLKTDVQIMPFSEYAVNQSKQALVFGSSSIAPSYLKKKAVFHPLNAAQTLFEQSDAMEEAIYYALMMAI